MAPTVDIVQDVNNLSINKDKKKIAGRCDIELGDVTQHNVLQLKRLNQNLFPVSYNDKFYSEILNAGQLAKFAYFNDVIVGAVCCRYDTHEGRKSLYIMTLGTLAPYRQLGIGTLLLKHVLDIGESDSSIHNLFLHVQVNNETALAFYKRYGFELVGVAEKYYKRINPDNAYILVKKMRN
ncbi:unnamed protein product [Auanema sp. JU1783]|nr:unnamed protein product [Auanema sp. JU1783]